jgi:hypothetical protein
VARAAHDVLAASGRSSLVAWPLTVDGRVRAVLIAESAGDLIPRGTVLERLRAFADGVGVSLEALLDLREIPFVFALELFRPLAPIVLAEELSRFFNIGCESPFMLFAPSVHSAAKELAPAVVHCDDTARLQTVSRESDPVVHALVSAFARKTGVPIILNTSLNGKDEPIVETPEEAVKAFLVSPLKYLFLGPFVVTREVNA